MFPISDSIPSKRFPFLSIAAIIATFYVFFQQIISPSQAEFIERFALIPSLVDLNNPQTFLPFVTAIFLHGGILHIVSNMWFMWVFGDNVEGYLGLFLFPILYLSAGVIGNIVQYSLMPDSSIPMLGASGAVAGVLGAYFVMFPNSTIKTLVPVFIFLTTVDIPAYFMLGYWFFLQVLSGAISFNSSGQGGIAFFAHVGGFVTGVLIAEFSKKIIRNNQWSFQL